MTAEWKKHLLYTIFVGKKDREGKKIAKGKFYGELWNLEESLKKHLGAITKVRVVEAVGDTLRWGTEESSLIIMLTDMEQKANDLLTKLTSRLNKTLNQDEIWITKYPVTILISKLDK